MLNMEACKPLEVKRDRGSHLQFSPTNSQAPDLEITDKLQGGGCTFTTILYKRD